MIEDFGKLYSYSCSEIPSKAIQEVTEESKAHDICTKAEGKGMSF